MRNRAITKLKLRESKLQKTLELPNAKKSLMRKRRRYKKPKKNWIKLVKKNQASLLRKFKFMMNTSRMEHGGKH